LEAVETTLSEKPLNVAKANSVLREAIDRMVMFPTQARLDIYWRHAGESQETNFGTSRIEWDSKQQGT
jgi:hypothetical protein